MYSYICFITPNADDHKVFVLTRSATKAASVFPAPTYPGVTIAEQGDWEACVRGSSAVVNLAGMPISTRWSPEVKQEIKRSRVNVTSKVVKYINHAGNADAQPSVFVSATAIGYYGTSEIHSFDESSPSGNDYLAEVRFISCSLHCLLSNTTRAVQHRHVFPKKKRSLLTACTMHRSFSISMRLTTIWAMPDNMGKKRRCAGNGRPQHVK